MTSDQTLFGYYKNAFSMCYLHKFCTLTEYENMIRFELDVYSSLITENAIRESDARKEQESLAKAIARQQGF